MFYRLRQQNIAFKPHAAKKCKTTVLLEFSNDDSIQRFSCGKLELFIIEFFLCWDGRGGKLLFNVKKMGSCFGFQGNNNLRKFFIFHLLTVTGVSQKYGEVLEALWKSSRCLESEKKCIWTWLFQPPRHERNFFEKCLARKFPLFFVWPETVTIWSIDKTILCA